MDPQTILILNVSFLVCATHSNLANNRIESLDDGAFGTDNANLISLNLNGNPLHRMAANSLVHLVKLKTL